MSIFVFFDESGNLDFGPRGSRYFCFGVLTLRDPAALTTSLACLRYRLLSEGLDLECFHAAEDRQQVRDQVFAALREVGGFELDFLVADKEMTPVEYRNPFAFYARLGYQLLDHVLARHQQPDESIVIVTDTLPLHRDRKALAKAFRSAIRGSLGDRPFSIVHHASSAHAGLQAADYCTWAIQRKWQRGDTRSYELIREWISSEQEVFAEPEGRA